MAPEKAPAFQFYPKDLLADATVVAMTLAERGAYFTLYCFCWINKGLPSDPRRLAHLTGVPEKAFLRLWPAIKPCFVEGAGRLTHPGLETERAKQEAYRHQQSEKGKASAAARQPRLNRTPNQTATAVQPNHPPDGNSPISDLRTPYSARNRVLPPSVSGTPVW